LGTGQGTLRVVQWLVIEVDALFACCKSISFAQYTFSGPSKSGSTRESTSTVGGRVGAGEVTVNFRPLCLLLFLSGMSVCVCACAWVYFSGVGDNTVPHNRSVQIGVSACVLVDRECMCPYACWCEALCRYQHWL